jgi:hypothetical protein
METPAAPSKVDRTWPWNRLTGAVSVVFAMGAYYLLFFLPPRAIGSVDPDRYFHLGLSKIEAAAGLVRALPQAEDLGWGRFFPDKEFLFHALTGAAQALGGDTGVLALVPLLAIAIFLLLFAEGSRVLRPSYAAVWVILAGLVTAAFMFRLSLLRPHLVSILCFCLVVMAILRSRPWLALVSAMAFAMAYHAFYLVVLASAWGFAFRRSPGMDARPAWAWALVGLALGVVLNPYFPGNVAMGILHLRLALGLSPGLGGQGLELQAFGLRNFWLIYGYFPVGAAVILAAALLRRPAASAEASRFWFLMGLAATLLVLGLKSIRAMEYAVPVAILLTAYSVQVLGRKEWLGLHCALLVLIQGATASAHYARSWAQPQLGSYAAFAHAISQLPSKKSGAKVFNCEWEAGAYLLYLRPDLRFVDLLEPAFLQAANPRLYEIRKLLVQGALLHPQRELRRQFDADYVLCMSPALVAQMSADPDNFQSLPGTERDPVRLFVVRPNEPTPERPRQIVPIQEEFKPLELLPGDP